MADEFAMIIGKPKPESNDLLKMTFMYKIDRELPKQEKGRHRQRQIVLILVLKFPIWRMLIFSTPMVRPWKESLIPQRYNPV